MPQSLPSPHLTWDEMGCNDGTPYPEAWRHTRAIILAAEFEAVRELYGKPLYVNSAYRTPAWNTKVGGSKASQHCEGRALDLQPLWRDRVDNKAVIALWRAASERAQRPLSRIRGLGFYPWGVHIDIRPADTLVTWDERR